MTSKNALLAVVPLLMPAWFLLNNILGSLSILNKNSSNELSETNKISSQLLAYVVVASVGFLLTNRLIPNIQEYTLRKGICGKDLGKRGTPLAEKQIPEALGIASGTIFLVCLIICLVGYASSHPDKMLDVNSALLSICFMLFLGFTDDVLDWPWRYKLVLPTVASLPLLCCYKGSTSIVVPIPIRPLIASDNQLTLIGRLAELIVEIHPTGSLVDLRVLYHIYMGMLAVFCTNAINIYAGINGLEAGQSFVIGCFILVHNLIEIQAKSLSLENHLFSAMIIMSFVGVTLGLLMHNWFPATVFVGDTFCYFAGMTFAVVGILGHFSKTLLLFFLPQIVNFIWSTPQLFKFVPCPRHRLPAVRDGKMHPSTFECEPSQYVLLKRFNGLDPKSTTIPNMTVINLFLTFYGPLSERDLCLALLAIQWISCTFGLFIRYYVAQFFFD